MRIIFWGTPNYAVQSLKDLLNSEHQVIAVVTQPDKKRSRGNKLIPSPIKELSIENNIPVFTPENIKNDYEFLSILKSLRSDVFVVVAYGKILTKEVLEIPILGCWNAHASLLPRWRGAAPIQWSILEGDSYTGVGIMKMEEGLDTGDILIEEKIAIKDNDNFVSLSEKLSKISSNLIINSLRKISKKNLTLTKQENLNRKIKYARILIKNDYLIDFNQSSLTISRKIKALYPQMYINLKDKNLKITKIEIVEESDFINYNLQVKDVSNKPGTVLKILKNKGIMISTKSNPIILLEGKLEGKNIANGNNLIQQLKLNIGEEI